MEGRITKDNVGLQWTIWVDGFDGYGNHLIVQCRPRHDQRERSWSEPCAEIY